MEKDVELALARLAEGQENLQARLEELTKELASLREGPSPPKVQSGTIPQSSGGSSVAPSQSESTTQPSVGSSSETAELRRDIADRLDRLEAILEERDSKEKAALVRQAIAKMGQEMYWKLGAEHGYLGQGAPPPDEKELPEISDKELPGYEYSEILGGWVRPDIVKGIL